MDGILTTGPKINQSSFGILLNNGRPSMATRGTIEGTHSYTFVHMFLRQKDIPI